MDELKKIFNKAKEISLSKEENNNLKANILDFAKSNPVKPGHEQEFNYRPKNLWAGLFGFNINAKFAGAMALVVVIVSAGGGMSFAAEKSLPGDRLYPVKVKFNEEVKARFALSDEADAGWEARRLERRLEEVEKLVIEGNITEDSLEKIEENFENHAERVQEKIEELQAKNHLDAAADISSNLETSLRVHRDILSRLEQKNLPSRMDKHINSAAKVRIEAESEINSKDQNAKASAGARINAAENKLAEIRKYIENKKARITNYSEAVSRLNEVQAVIDKARGELNTGNYNQTSQTVQEALRKAQEIKLSLEVQSELRLELKIDDDDDDDDGDSSRKVPKILNKVQVNI